VLFNRAPSVKAPQLIKAFGVELNVSIITVLVLVGFLMAFSSTYMQVQDYERQLNSSRLELAEKEKQLRRAGKLTLTPLVVLTDISSLNPMPKVSDVFCTYTMRDGGDILPNQTCAISTGVAETSFQVTLHNVPASADILRIDIREKRLRNPRCWSTKVSVGFPLSPKIELQQPLNGSESKS
jgi:hypothetical protein